MKKAKSVRWSMLICLMRETHTQREVPTAAVAVVYEWLAEVE
jgi:hypothetical protein